MTENPKILKHDSRDWCHFCGERREDTADVWRTSNAEHKKTEGRHPHSLQYVRICAGCCARIGAIASGQKEVVDAEG